MEILLIDDQPNMGSTFTKILNALNHNVTYVQSGKEVLQFQDSELNEYDLIFIDMMMPEMDGCETGLAIKARIPDTVTIMLTADSSIETVIKALRDSKFDDYLNKSDVAKDAFSGSFKLQEALLRAQTLIKTRQALRNTQNALSQEYQLTQILRKQSLVANKELIGDSPAFQKMLRLVRKVARSDTTILLQGETGTGKELIAREIHRQSFRAHEPFVAINCGAIPKDLLESELFGHRRGSFTGASNDREGFFQLANGGTLFLDEIGDMPLALQVKLLRVLQEHEIMPVGGDKSFKIDVRIISATHQNLPQQIEEKKFREDLFYRLNVFPIQIPPLRERVTDIPLIVQQIIKSKAKYIDVQGATTEALEVLKTQTWKGNIRELENVVERAMLVTNQKFLVPEDFIELSAVTPDESHEITSVPYETRSRSTHEKLWDNFVQNECKLWTFDNHDQIKFEMNDLLHEAEYQKKGHFGFIKIKKNIKLKLGLSYINANSYEMDHHTIHFEFLSNTTNPRNKEGMESNTNKNSQLETEQSVLKGLPDTYIFDILYPPSKRNEMNLISPQQLIRALILRYAQTYVPTKNLKEIFQDVMEFLIDPSLVNKIKGLNKDGLEATRACLCSNSHIFPGIASQLKTNPQYIESEIQQIFPQYQYSPSK